MHTHTHTHTHTYNLYIKFKLFNFLFIGKKIYSLQFTRTVYFPSKNKLKQKIISRKIQVKVLHYGWDDFAFYGRKFILES